MDNAALKSLGKDFYIEITSPGYESQTMQVNWSKRQDKNITLKPTSIKIGIDEIKGEDNSIATSLSKYLKDSGLSLDIFDPSALIELRNQIADNRAAIAAHPLFSQAGGLPN